MRFVSDGPDKRSAAEAMIESCRKPLRPIAMTDIAAITGMLPIALALRSGLADASASGDRRNRWNRSVDVPLAAHLYLRYWVILGLLV